MTESPYIETQTVGRGEITITMSCATTGFYRIVLHRDGVHVQVAVQFRKEAAYAAFRAAVATAEALVD